MARTVLGALLGVLLFVLTVNADRAGRRSLNGLQALRVEVVVSGPEPAEAASLGSMLQTNVELRLRQNRVRVQENVEGIPGRPVLRIIVVLYKNPEGIDVYAISAWGGLEQDVLLHRNKSQARAGTWRSYISVGLTNSGAFRDSVRENVSGIVDEFVNDFLAENPR
jgi:hypothetical protein